MLGKALQTAAAGNAGGEVLGVEDVFNTWLYTGNGSTQTISGLGFSPDFVWIKERSSTSGHNLFDTVRGVGLRLRSDGTFAETSGGAVTAFNVDGFDLNSDTAANELNQRYASWTFRKTKKFFDVVTYTGDGTNRTIAHNLGSVPGTIFVKRTDATADWQVYHRSLANTEYIVLNSTAAKATGTTRWNSTTPTSSVFSLGTDATVNASGGTYVAYLFAHDAGGFGDTRNKSVVKCGNFAATAGTFVDLGWEPQWILTKNTQSANDWAIVDTMRGITTGGNDPYLLANTSAAEVSSSDLFDVSATGFTCKFSASGNNYIYIAIRRGPMKTPTSAGDVFSTQLYTGNGSTQTISGLGFSPDLVWIKKRAGGIARVHCLQDNLRGAGKTIQSDSTAAEYSDPNAVTSFNSDGFSIGIEQRVNESGGTYVAWTFERAEKFFDVVTYTGTGSATTVEHGLDVTPNLIIVKSRSAVGEWVVYHETLGRSAFLQLQATAASTTVSNYWGTSDPSSTAFSLNTFGGNNFNGRTYVAYLFATLPDISKVGSYTGTGTTLNIDCGFTSGARFVLIKRTDSTGDWYVWDTARGIVSGNDPYLLSNSSAAEVTSTDYIDPLSSGFQISSTAPAAINANGGSYIYLAIA